MKIGAELIYCPGLDIPGYRTLGLTTGDRVYRAAPQNGDAPGRGYICIETAGGRYLGIMLKADLISPRAYRERRFLKPTLPPMREVR